MVNLQVKRLFGNRVDGVVEAVHLSSQGQIKWVRAYERRGPTWSDHVLLDRDTLIERLKSGRKFFAGKRITYQASEFELGEPIRLRQTKRGDAIVTDDLESEKDRLEGVPTL